MSSHQRLLLADVISISHGFAFPGEYFSEDPSLPVLVTPGNFAVGGGFQERDKTFGGTIPATYELRPGDLVVTMTDLSRNADTLGLPAIIPSNGRRYLHNQRIGRVSIMRPELVDLQFLSYYLRTPAYRSHIIGGASGSTVRHTSPGRILEFTASVPDLCEQHAIAAVLGALDDKIAANTALAKTAEDFAAALSASSTATCLLGDLAALDRRTVAPSILESDRVNHYSIPAFDLGKQPSKDAVGAIKSNKFLIDEPRVLVSKLNPRFPRVWAVDQQTGLPGLASTELLPLKALAVPYRVLSAVLASPSFGSRLAGQVAGTSGSHQRVRPQDLLASTVDDPRMLSPETAALADDSVGLAIHSRSESATLAELRDTLLPALMSGRLRVKDAEKSVEDAV